MGTKTLKKYELCCKNNIYALFDITRPRIKICKKVFYNGITATSHEQATRFIQNNLSKHLLEAFMKYNKIRYITF